MKKLLFTLSLLGAFAASADEIDASAQIFGCLPITSGEPNVIVAVPWVAATNGVTNAISVAEIVKTANLTKGDWIRVWDDATKKFKVWTLVSNEVTNIQSWEPAATVDGKGLNPGSPAGDAALKRGDALVLHRQNPKDVGGNAKTFYVYGQYLSTSASDLTCALATVEYPKAYTLIAPPNVTDTAINDITWTNVGAEDYLTIPTGRLVWHNNEWGSYGVKKFGASSRPWNRSTYQVKAGTGLWYTSTDTNATHQAVVVHW